MATRTKCVFDNVLQKKGEGWTSGWRVRRFRLFDNGELVYLDGTEAKGIIDVHKIVKIERNGLYINLHHQEGRIFHLYSKDEGVVRALSHDISTVASAAKAATAAPLAAPPQPVPRTEAASANTPDGPKRRRSSSLLAKGEVSYAYPWACCEEKVGHTRAKMFGAKVQLGLLDEQTGPEWRAPTPRNKIIERAKERALEMNRVVPQCLAFACHEAHGVQFYNEDALAKGLLADGAGWLAFLYEPERMLGESSLDGQSFREELQACIVEEAIIHNRTAMLSTPTSLEAPSSTPSNSTTLVLEYDEGVTDAVSKRVFEGDAREEEAGPVPLALAASRSSADKVEGMSHSQDTLPTALNPQFGLLLGGTAFESRSATFPARSVSSTKSAQIAAEQPADGLPIAFGKLTTESANGAASIEHRQATARAGSTKEESARTGATTTNIERQPSDEQIAFLRSWTK